MELFKRSEGGSSPTRRRLLLLFWGRNTPFTHCCLSHTHAAHRFDPSFPGSSNVPVRNNANHKWKGTFLFNSGEQHDPTSTPKSPSVPLPRLVVCCPRPAARQQVRGAVVAAGFGEEEGCSHPGGGFALSQESLPRQIHQSYQNLEFACETWPRWWVGVIF